jgi:hypothetical protein
MKNGFGDLQTVTPELLRTTDNGRPFQQVEGYLDDVSLPRRFKKRALGPAIEGAHRGATPDLIVEFPLGISGDSPTTGFPKIPTENQRHAMFRVFFSLVDLSRASLSEEISRLTPNG